MHLSRFLIAFRLLLETGWALDWRGTFAVTLSQRLACVHRLTPDANLAFVRSKASSLRQMRLITNRHYCSKLGATIT